jgi:hypothetical protein
MTQLQSPFGPLLLLHPVENGIDKDQILLLANSIDDNITEPRITHSVRAGRTSVMLDVWEATEAFGAFEDRGRLCIGGAWSVLWRSMRIFGQGHRMPPHE